MADPPKLLGPSPLYTLRLDRRPKLEHLRSDERFARELRALLRANLDMRCKDFAGPDRWYQPHGTNGWQKIPQLFDNPIGHEELRAWCDRERAKLRAGVDLNELVRLIGRFVHVGVAVDVLLKDAEAAREFAAVDVMALLMAEMPEGVSRVEASERLEKLQPDHHSADGDVTTHRIRKALRKLDEPTVSRGTHAVAMAANCRVGLERLVRRFTPAEDAESGEAAPQQDGAPEVRVSRAAECRLQELGRPLPVPTGLLPRLTQETRAPKGDAASARPRYRSEKDWWPSLQPAALAGRVAAGADCLAADPSGLAGEPHLLALPRIAAWLAYRTPAGDPLRPAIGTAISRLRTELTTAPGPLIVVSLQDNYLMSEPPSTRTLTAHPAVTRVADKTHSMSHLRVDPAALKGPDDPLLESLDDYLDSPSLYQWLPSPSGLPAIADLRLLLSDDFAALGEHLLTDGDRSPGWEQHPAHSVPHLVDECAKIYGLGEDAAALYLMLLALPDPTDRNVKEWTGWKPARFKAAETELGASHLVLRAIRPRAGRALFLPGAWHERKPPRLPIEASKLGLVPLARERRSTSHMAAVPSGPLPGLFTRAWEGRKPR
ncbi:hypothetical protein AB0I10_29915 [Streptomyces sp. NPDC050636]|uniref:hypothetical protein n=1 Tax=Streptomyces sp. NPDC050636 TaxID=3154510 RepID=UPI00343B0718